MVLSIFKSFSFTVLSFGRSFSRNMCNIFYQPCLTRPSPIGFNPAEVCYYPFVVISDSSDGSCNTFSNLFDRLACSR